MGPQDQTLALADAGFEWRALEGDAVIYDHLSGSTHRVLRPAGDLLQLLDRLGPTTRAELWRRAASTGAVDEADFSQALTLLIEVEVLIQN